MATFDINHAASLSSLCVIDGNASKAADLNISCLEACGDLVYVGCGNGMILVFVNDTMTKGQLLLSHYDSTNFKSSIICLKAVSALNFLLVLSGDCLFPVTMDSLEIAFNPKLKNITAFCLNQNPVDDNPFQVQFCIGRKRSVQVALLTEGEIKITKEISVSFSPISLAMDANRICIAAVTDYVIIDVQSKEIQPLFTRDSSQPAIVERTSKGEFLVTGPGNLGVFVLAEGFSSKPPISWRTVVSAVAVHHPYILTLSSDGITVYSLIDQQLKQSIAVPNLKCLVHGDGRIWASTESEIFGLVDFSWDVQLEKLLNENRVEEALKLTSHIPISTDTKEKYSEIIRQLQQRVAFVHLSKQEFAEARDLILTSQIHVKEVISLLPDLLPRDFKSSLSFPESVALAGEVAANQDFSTKIENFIKELLITIRSSLPDDQQRIADGALLKMLVESNSSELADFVPDCNFDEEETKTLLKESRNFHSLALFCYSHREMSKAFEIWEKLVNEELLDGKFPGLDIIAEKLVESLDFNLVLRYSGSILKKDCKTGLRIFKEIFQRKEVVGPELEAICYFLNDYRDVLKEVLEFLVLEKKSEDPKIHTQLALLYISDSNSGRNSPAKLRTLLRNSKKLDFKELQKKIDLVSHPHEFAIICGRLGDHEKAIKLFLVQLKDFNAAVEYCSCVSDSRSWTQLVHLCTTDTANQFLDDLINLIKLKPHYFDLVTTLEALPATTQMSNILPFIKYALRESLHQYRSHQIQVAMSLAHLNGSRYRLAVEQRDVFSIQPSSFCCVCKKNLVLNEKVAIARFPNGVVAHAYCVSRRNVCPVTGRVFCAEAELQD